MRIADAEVPVAKLSLLAVLFIILVCCLGFLASGGDLASYEFWAPKRAAAENKVFHNTQQYVDGKVSYLGKLCRERARTTRDQQAAFNDEIANEALTIDAARLPADLQACVAQAKGY